MSSGPPVPDGRVLSTLMEDGSRRWLHPRLAAGPYLRARRILAYVLIAVFTLLPYLKIGGKPAVLLDLPHREFTIFGFTFLSTDTLLLALALITLVLGICLVTALAGRVWCGWMCPQTVYMEFVFRPIERLFDGPPGARHRPGRKRTTPRTVAKYAVYLVISAYLAHTFLAYFVGVEALAQWVRRSPLEHPVSFLVMLAVTGLMMFDFAYFREQTCIVACPYGRFQSVMLDRDSLIVSYDPRRGEPRGKLGDRKSGPSAWRLHRLRPVHRHLPHGHRYPRRSAIGVHRLHAVHRRLQWRDGADRQAQGADPAEFASRHRRRAAAGWLRTAGDPLSGPDARAGDGFPGRALQQEVGRRDGPAGLGLPYSETAPARSPTRCGWSSRTAAAATRSTRSRLPATRRPISPASRRPFPLRPARPPRRPWRSWPRRRPSSGASATFSLRVSDDKTFQQEVACRLLGPVRAGGGRLRSPVQETFRT